MSDLDLNQLANDIARGLGVVGGQVALLHQGEIRSGSAGLASLRSGAIVTDATLFQVGSTTKVLTAALVMQLVEQGLVGLDIPVVEQLPGFHLSEPEATRTVTPRHLMSMSSGIDNGSYDDLGDDSDALSRYVGSLEELPVLFPPGKGFGYSNGSTNVSGRLIEHTTGRTWDDVLRAQLLEPLGLRDSSTNKHDVLRRPHAMGHSAGPEGPSEQPKWSSLTRCQGPAGATLCSTASDLVRFSRLFLEGGLGVLGAEAIAEMTRPQVEVPPTLLADWWGLGPYGKRWQGGDLVGHSGTNLGGSSYLLWAPEQQVAVATVVNTPALGYPFAKACFEELFGTYAGLRPPTKPTMPAHVDLDAERLVGRYADASTTFTVSHDGGQLLVAVEGTHESCRASPLVPLTPTTFLPTHPAVDGNRGWAVAFLGSADGPATHLVNGFFTLRRLP